MENALTAGEPAESSPEAAQQWDEYDSFFSDFSIGLFILFICTSVLTNIHTHFAQWSSLDTVQSFLQSDQIRSDIDQLYAELKWCGMNVEVPSHHVLVVPNRFLTLSPRTLLFNSTRSAGKTKTHCKILYAPLHRAMSF